jgi:hypothetical protein
MPGWKAADETTKQRILNAAAKYLVVGQTSIEEWIGTTSLRRNDMAAFRAMLLLRHIKPTIYEQIASSSWAKWAPVVAAVPKRTERGDVELQAGVVHDALHYAPTEFVGAIRTIVRAERARAAANTSEAPQSVGTSFFVLCELDGSWDSAPLKAGLFEELRNESNSEDQFGVILDVLLAAQFEPARNHALELLAAVCGQLGSFALAAAVALTRHCVKEAWPAIWRLLVADPSFAQNFFLRISHHYRLQDAFFAPLDEAQLAELYVYLEHLFPREGDPQHASGEAHFVGPRESLAHLRDAIPSQIASRGTVAAVEAMQQIVHKLPKLDWLPYRLLEAQQMMRIKTWAPLTPKELFRVVASKNRVLIQSADDLCEVLVESLLRYEDELHGEQAPIRALWDRQAGGRLFRPVEEDSLSDSVTLFLRRELVETGIIANREVEIARVPGDPIGERTDIRVDALRRSSDGSAYDKITAVIEVKGCWNAALFTALRDQLYDDYMVRLHAPVGIYLVGWFDKLKWDPEDYRRRRSPNCTLREARDRLDAQAAAIPAGFVVRSVVVDCHAP